MAALRSKWGNCSFTYRRGSTISSALHDYRRPRYGKAYRLAVCNVESRIPRSAAHRLRGSLCFAALWYADSFIHRKQTCLASSKVLGASGQLQNERRRMRKLGQVPPTLKSSLTDFQIAWVRLQARVMNISYERLTGTILNEWFSNHPRMLVGRHDSKEIIRRAWDDFIRCHSAEFLPVSLSDLLDQS